MPDWIWAAAAVYAIVALSSLYVGLVLTSEWETYDVNRKTGARLALASPVWPLAILWGLWMGISYLWAVATDDD